MHPDMCMYMQESLSVRCYAPVSFYTNLHMRGRNDLWLVNAINYISEVYWN